MTYWIDTGGLLQAHRDSLTYSILPQFWNKYLHDHLIAGNIAMPRIAYEEVTEKGYDDWLVAWCKARKKAGLCCKENGRFKSSTEFYPHTFKQPLSTSRSR